MTQAQQSERKMRLRRVRGAWCVLCVALMGLLVRLWWLQVLQAERYDELARSRCVRALSFKAPRGVIYDRYMRAMATSTVSYAISIIPSEFEPTVQRMKLLSNLLGVSGENIEAKLKSAEKRLFEPVKVKESVDIATLTKVAEHQFQLPGVVVEEEPVRQYLVGEVAAHILGHLGQVSKEELKERQDVQPGDQVGKLGVEFAFDEYLQGKKGQELLEVDATGMPVRSLGVKRLKRGSNLVLTIDLDIQRAAAEALRGKVGAAVVMSVNSGEVLALVSSPSFDPNIFSGRVDKKAWLSLVHDPQHPLQNRAIGSSFPPGSTFKVITAAAGLATKVIQPHTRFYCPGSFQIGRRSFRCWRAHGSVNLYQAIGRSCDVYFYNVGRMVGAERLARYAKAFGLGKRTGIDLRGEAKGTLPCPIWKRKRYNQPWYGGDTINMSIGQGYVATTPLQMCQVAAAIANGGVLCEPHLLKAVLSPEGKVQESIPANINIVEHISVAPAHLQVIREGMRLAVYGAGGTAHVMSDLPFTVAGKTGSSQHRKGCKPHAWFICFVPFHQPKIACCVFVEAAGHGGEVAAPIAHTILKSAQRFINRSSI